MNSLWSDLALIHYVYMALTPDTEFAAMLHDCESFFGYKTIVFRSTIVWQPELIFKSFKGWYSN